jgi:hypothetical protein
MTKSERFALMQWLSNFPEDMSYAEVLDRLEGGNDDVVVWETLEEYPVDMVIDTIEGTRMAFEEAVK